jgi:IS5 family transposase
VYRACVALIIVFPFADCQLRDTFGGGKISSEEAQDRSAASVADKHMLPDLLHGEERKVWGDGGYQGQTEAIHEAAPHAQDMTWPQDEVQKLCGRRSETKEHNQVESKSESRTCVPHLETRFGFDRVRYRGIAKNHHRLCANFALINLYLHRKRLAVLGA